MRRIAAIAISSATILGLAVLAATRQTRDGAIPENTQMNEEVARLRSELEATKREERATRDLAASAVEAAQRQAHTTRLSPDSSEAAPRREGPAEGLAPTMRKEPSFEELHADLESRFAAQPRDDAWSRAAVEQVTQKLTAALPPSSRFLSVDCRESICRAEIAHADVERHREYLKGSIVTPGNWDGPVLAVLEESPGKEGVITVAYIGKRGTNLFPQEVAQK